MRKSTVYFLFTLGSVILLAVLLWSGRYGAGEAGAMQEASKILVQELQLTDLCLFTEARYTRHPAMADLHSAFQDHPLALEHFPSGSLATPPRFRRERP
ncbi:MAG: hypothetical protein H6Q79_1183 [Deltaproteobacteria bacterium]|nr:hypothetical protein [Deltaproteobacteria bacterium]MBP2686116.1 hypothetical protein [Deltaproteobacteria bacterium]